MTNIDPNNSQSAAMRQLPSVDSLLNQPTVASLLDEFARSELVFCIRAVLDEKRAAIRTGEAPPLDFTSIALDIRQQLYRRSLPNLRRVINATGIVLHTNLGRAPLAEEAIEAINEVAAGYSNLEYDLRAGRRGSRYDHARDLLRELTGVEDALVVNNNAAGTFLALNSLGRERPALISRGQLVEIGGSYRMPDIMAAAGCRMVEVGTTNRTHIADYERAIDEETALLLRVHTSNYRVQGFVTSPTLEDLVALARKYPRQNIVVIDDLGSGLLESAAPPIKTPAEDATDDTEQFGLDWDEPTVKHSIAAGADITLFSGDKLLGGPQAGIILGRAELIERIRKNPLTRTFRPDKMTLAGLEATLRLYRNPETLAQRLPIRRMLCESLEKLEQRANRLTRCIAELIPEVDVITAADESYAGGGTLPTLPFATRVTALKHPDIAPECIAAELRGRDLPIICRVRDDTLIFDSRTLSNDDLDQIPGAVLEAIREIDSD